MNLDQLITHFGTHAAIANALGIKAPSVYGWGVKVPALRQIQLEHITNGALKADAGILPVHKAAA